MAFQYFRIFLCLLSLFLSPMFYQSSVPFAKGDAALILNVCNQTLEPSFCNMCFESYPWSVEEDVRGLGGTAINCPYILSLSLGQVVYKMVASATVDACRTAYMFCATKFDAIEEHFVNALLNWGAKDYKNSALHSVGAYQDLIACATELKDGVGDNDCFTQEIIHGFHTFSAFCDVAAGVVNQIH